MIDIHCHLLFGLDDGAEDLNDSMLISMMEYKEGVETIIATPHYIEGESEVTPESIYSGVDVLERELKSSGLDMNVLPGMEIYITPNLPKLFEEGKVIALNNKNHMLIELPLYESIPRYLEDVLFALQLKGIKPVIAHPERYRSVIEHPNIVFDLIEKGCLMQVNGASIEGKFGSDVQRTAAVLLKHDMVHFIGSDGHSGGRRISSFGKSVEYVKGKFGNRTAEALFGRNAESVIRGEEIRREEPERIRRKVWGLL